MYIVFVFPFICYFIHLFFHTFFCYIHRCYGKVLVKVSPVVIISVPTYQKTFIFEPMLPWMVGIYIMNPDPRVNTPGLCLR